MNSDSASAAAKAKMVERSFLLTDIQDSTGHWNRAGEEFREALRRHHELIREEISRFGGEELSEAGDGFLIAFNEAKSALACGLAIQSKLLQCAWPPAIGRLLVRMGLHAGEVEILGPQGYRGPLLNQAARVREAAHGGQIVCSSVVAQRLAEIAELKNLGLFRLRGMEKPERLFQIRSPGMPEEGFPPPNAPAAFTDNLPSAFNRFFGRFQEIDRLRAMLLERAQTRDGAVGRLITLTGPGGTGKTRLSLAVAASLLNHFSHAVWFVPLADVSDAKLLPSVLRNALGIVPDAKDPLEAVVAMLGSEWALLVFDNFEQLANEGADFLHRLLQRLPLARCLVTSRQKLGLPGEREFSVPPLTIPRPDDAFAEITSAESVQLFVDRAQAVRSSFVLKHSNASHVAALCRRLEGVPLAIELAAARADVNTPLEMLEALSRRLDYFAATDPNVPARHRSLRAAIDWSFEFLPRNLQQFFARLSVFRGGAAADATERVAAAGLEGIEGNVFHALGQLRVTSLLHVEERHDRMRYRMLETLRQYAEERLLQEPDAAEVQKRHQVWCMELAEKVKTIMLESRSKEWMDQLEMEHDNFRAALALPSLDDHSLRLAVALASFWMVRGHCHEGREWLRKLMAQPREYELRQRARTFNAAGILAWSAGDWHEARAHFGETLAASREEGHLVNVAAALNNLGMVACRLDDFDAGRAYYEESLKIYREIGNEPFCGQVVGNLGACATRQKDYRSARVWLEEAQVLARRYNDQFALGNVLSHLGHLASAEGRFDEALEWHEKSLEVRHALGDKSSAAPSFVSLTAAAVAVGKWEEAARWLGAAHAAEGKTNLKLPAVTQRDYEKAMEQVAGQFDEETLNALLQGGVEYAERWLRSAGKETEECE